MIVSAFLAGIGLGSYLGGRLSLKTSHEMSMRVFGALELAIGAFAWLSIWIYYDVLFLRAGALYADPVRAGFLHFGTLMVPTALMGMSLPFMTQAMVRNHVSASRTIGLLYGVNVLGAAFGALITPWFLIRYFGIEQAVRIGAVCNVSVGLAALALSFASSLSHETASRRDHREKAQREAKPVEPAGDRPLSLWIALYALSGFCALSLEILWFRIVDVAVKSTAFTFGTVLSIYLAGLGLGSLAGGPLAMRTSRPLRRFLELQCASLVYSGTAIWVLVSAPPDSPGLQGLVRYWQEYVGFQLGHVSNPEMVLTLYLGLPLMLYGLPTFLMGLSFAVLQRAVQDEERTSGFKVGVLQSANIVGNVAGSLLTGLLLLYLIGTSGSLRLLMGIGLVFAFVGISNYRKKTGFIASAAALTLLLVIMPDNDSLWARLHGQPARAVTIDEDASSVVAITPEAERRRVSVNGKGHSWLPFGGSHSHLGAIPAAVHPAPKKIAIVGLGSGDTAWAAGFRGETSSLTVFELSSAEVRLLRGAAERDALPKLETFLDDPRVTIVVADGRNALAHDDERYDIIQADALRPQSAYSGNLYSVEFFRLCSSRLEPGGLMCTWAPTPRIRRSFLEVFPHVIEFGGGEILVGSDRPIPPEGLRWIRNLNSVPARDYLGNDLAIETMQVIRTARPALPGDARVLPNFDLFPRDEFATPVD